MAKKETPRIEKTPERKQIVEQPRSPEQPDVKPTVEVVDLPTGARSHPPEA